MTWNQLEPGLVVFAAGAILALCKWLVNLQQRVSRLETDAVDDKADRADVQQKLSEGQLTLARIEERVLTLFKLVEQVSVKVDKR